MPKRILASLLFSIVLLTFASSAAVRPGEPQEWPLLERYEPMAIPAANPMTRAKVDLGRQLFFDKRLSGDGSTACVSCHQPEHGLTDPRPRSIGAYGIGQDRSCPTLWNVGYQRAFFWEGSAKEMEDTIDGVWRYILAPKGEGRATAEEIAKRIGEIPGYRSQFLAAFGAEATAKNIPQALATYLRTLVANESAWVRFQSGDANALSAAARRGWALFDGEAGCTGCHNGILLTDLQYHNVGAGMSAAKPDLGRFSMTKEDRHRGAFKTPTLLNVSRTAPYFHDGSVATLPEAVDRVLAGGFPNASLSPDLKLVKLTAKEREELLAFLNELTVDFKEKAPSLPD